MRRGAQLGALRGDLRVESLRGNVDTRLRKLDDGEFDAVVCQFGIMFFPDKARGMSVSCPWRAS